MGFPPPSAEEVTEWQAFLAQADAKIKSAEADLQKAKKKAILVPSTRFRKRFAPQALSEWVEKRFNTPETLQEIERATLHRDWMRYDRSKIKRPLYPRNVRSITPTNPDFDSSAQLYFAQSKARLFTMLPRELRDHIYRAIIGDLVVQIDARHGGFNGPPESRDRTVFNSSRLLECSTGRILAYGMFVDSFGSHCNTLHPAIVPMLQTCRRVYEEMLPLLYTTPLFKQHETHNSMEWPKFLLEPRLQLIRWMHLTVNLGYPWTAPSITKSFDIIKSMRGLRKLCVLGQSRGMVDLQNQELVDEKLWEAKRAVLMKLFDGLEFIQDVDVFLPIAMKLLERQNGGHIRYHGLFPGQGDGDVLCACPDDREPMKLNRTTGSWRHPGYHNCGI